MATSKAQRKRIRIERQALNQMPTEFGFRSPVDIQAADGTETPPSFNTLVYDGGLLKIDGFKFPVIVDLQGAKANDAGQLKAFLQHDPESPVGHVEDVAISNQIEMAGIFSVPGEDRDAVIEACKNGFTWETSIEASIPEPKVDNLDFIPAGHSVSVNDQSFTGPVIVARQSILMGFAFVGRGGGRNTTAQIAAKHKGQSMPVEIKAGDCLGRLLYWQLRDAGYEKSVQDGMQSVVESIAKDAGINADRVNSIAAGEAEPTMDELKSFASSLSVSTDELIDALREDGVSLPSEATSDPTTGDPPMAENQTADIQAAIEKGISAGIGRIEKSFNDRMNTIQAGQRVQEIANQYGYDGDDLTDIRASASKEGWTEKDIELAILRASRKRNAGGFEPLDSKSGAPLTQNVINAALGKTVAGFDDDFIAQHYGEKVADEIQARRWKGFGLKSMFVEYLKANGHPIYGVQVDESDVQAALRMSEAQRDIKASGNTGFSTFSLPTALGDLANKEMLRTYELLEPQLRRVAKESNNPDYKTKTHFRVTMSGGLEKMGADGQFPSVKLNEMKATSKVEPHGGKLTISIVDINNDDAGVFTDVARMFAKEASEAVEIRLATSLLAGIASGFWTTAKGNYVTGGASALDFTALSKAFGLFRELKDSNGKLVNLKPAMLTANPTDEELANQLHSSGTVERVMAGDTDKEKVTGNRNTLAGRFTPIPATYLGNGAVPAANGTQWLLSADPMITSPLVVAYLNGRKAPTITTWDKIPGTLGMQWDCHLSFYAGSLDDYAGILHAGQ